MVGLYNGRLQQDLAALDPAPVRTVPALRTAAGHVLQDTLAMAETLHEENQTQGCGQGMWGCAPLPVGSRRKCIRGLPRFGRTAR